MGRGIYIQNKIAFHPVVVYPLVGEKYKLVHGMDSVQMKKWMLAGLLMLSPLAALAAEASATVVAARGAVNAVSADGERALGQGDTVFVEEQVVTADRSFAVLQFVDGAKVTIRPNSAVTVEEYAFNGNDADAATLNLVEGGLRVITGAMAKTHPENYKVKTPVALMGVRGTEFSIMLCGDQICEPGQSAY